MRNVYYLACLLIMCLLLPACGRQVEVVQAHQFKLMADRMPNELIARDIIDNSRDYVPGVWSAELASYGDILYKRLSPDFIFSDVAVQVNATSFAQAVSLNPKENSVVMRKQGFGLVTTKSIKKRKRKDNITLERRIDVDMVAISDWDGDGKKDWFIACKLLRTRGAVPRIYYVVVPNPAPSGVLKGNVVAVYDDMGAFGRLYLRESAAKISAPVEDVVPGLRSVTTPPQQVNTKPQGIKERTLD